MFVIFTFNQGGMLIFVTFTLIRGGNVDICNLYFNQGGMLIFVTFTLIEGGMLIFVTFTLIRGEC